MEPRIDIDLKNLLYFGFADLYISKGQWFVKGSLALLLDDYRPDSNCGLFLGVIQKSNGPLSLDEEVCDFCEFDTLERQTDYAD